MKKLTPLQNLPLKRCAVSFFCILNCSVSGFFLLHYHPQILFLKLFARCLKNDFVCHVSNLDHGKSERGRTKNFPVVFLVEKTK